VKTARAALRQKSPDVKGLVAEAIRLLDKAVTKDVIHWRTAARQKSALAHRLAILS